MNEGNPVIPTDFELETAKVEIARLKLENQELREQVRSQSRTIREAKDISPIQRLSFKRVCALAKAACFDLVKVANKWIVSLGSLKRTFQKLRDAWDALNVEEFYLSDFFQPSDADIPKPLLAADNPHKRINPRYISVPFSDDGLIDESGMGYYSFPNSS